MNPTDEENCGNDDKKKQRNQQRTVSALSGLRPQHFTDALLVRLVAVEGSNLTYARSEFFQRSGRPHRREAQLARCARLLPP
jgi:hypothetical protein